MRVMGWGIAALALLAGAAVAVAQPPKGKGMPEGWWNNLWGSSKPREEPKPDLSAAPTVVPDRRRDQERLLRAFERREAVCNKLREIGIEMGNTSLVEEADELYDLACQIYNRQSARLTSGAARSEEGVAESTRPSISELSSRRGRGNSEPSRTGEGWR